MISINYQKLTADMLTRGKRRHHHEGKAEMAAMLLFSQGERTDSWAPPQSSSVPLKVCPEDLHGSTHLTLLFCMPTLTAPSILTSSHHPNPTVPFSISQLCTLPSSWNAQPPSVLGEFQVKGQIVILIQAHHIPVFIFVVVFSLHSFVP